MFEAKWNCGEKEEEQYLKKMVKIETTFFFGDDDDHDHYDVCPGKTVQRQPWKSTLGSIRPGKI